MDGTLIASCERTLIDAYGRHQMEVKLGIMFWETWAVTTHRRATSESTMYAQFLVGKISEEYEGKIRRIDSYNKLYLLRTALQLEFKLKQ